MTTGHDEGSLWPPSWYLQGAISMFEYGQCSLISSLRAPTTLLHCISLPLVKVEEPTLLCRNAILQRVVLTRSDLGRAEITGADFTNALVDKSQQMVSKV